MRTKKLKNKKKNAGKQNTRIYDHTVVTHHDHIYDIEVYGRRKLKKKRHSFFLQFDLIPHELCDSRHQLRGRGFSGRGASGRGFGRGASGREEAIPDELVGNFHLCLFLSL